MLKMRLGDCGFRGSANRGTWEPRGDDGGDGVQIAGVKLISIVVV